jgi:hypothetical protein
MDASALLANEAELVEPDACVLPGPLLVAGVDRFDPDAVIAGGSDGEVFPVEFVEELVRRASVAVEALQMLDPALLSKESVEVWAVGTEKVRRQVDAAGVMIAGHVDAANPFRKDGFLTAKAWLKHRLQLSGVEAFRRVQTARMQATLPLWANAAGAGEVGVAQSELFGQLATNPRLDPAVLRAGAWELFVDAVDLPYKVFEANVRMWERLADPEGAAEQAERNRLHRDADIKARHDGGWSLSASFDDVAGAEFADVFGHFVQAEWDADWAEARERVGDAATMFDLRRTQAQRRADALLAMARAAAACPPWSKRPLPTVNILIDHATFEAVLRGEQIDPMRYRNVVCRTRSGHQLHTADAVAVALVAHVRRVVYDSAGVVIELGRRQRLFTGSSRDAVMLLATACAWAGCDANTEWCQADHSLGWKAHGATVPRNGGPLCRRHNILKELGYRICRDDHGHWHTHHPDGHEIH